MVGQAVEEARAIHEGARQHPHLVTGCKGWLAVQLDESLVVLARLERANNAFRHRRRIVAIGDEPRHAEGGLDRPPALARDIDRHEHVTRKQRLRGEVHLAGVPAALQIARQIDRITLTPEVLRGLHLAVHLRLHHIPARADRFAHAEPSVAFAGGRRPKRAGASTRPWPQASTAASNDSLARVTSVTITASNSCFKSA